MADFITLGVESSCDDTSVAVVLNGTKILSNIISSQLDIHALYGGVVPEIAARCHLENLLPIYKLALEEAAIAPEQINLVAATYGPGLIGSLLVGLSFAKALSIGLKVPFIGVNHIEGHIYANILERDAIKPPLLCLTVSGGHTDLLYINEWGSYQLLGRTLDDAAGEAYDKVARILELGYPGGPPIDKIARGITTGIEFPQARNLADSYNFSFSGLKTAVINYVHRQRQLNQELNVPEIAAGFQINLVGQLIDKLFRAAKEYRVNAILLSGGVAANSYLREQCRMRCDELGIAFYYPDIRLCTDNAAMIAAAGYFRYQKDGATGYDLTANPNLQL